LDRLAVLDPPKTELVKLCHFAGLTIPQAAEVMGISTATASRHWTFARAWLHRELASSDEAIPMTGD
jgi:DNA-directed RNA polymerase specialized sigma24 family protein